MPGFRTHKKVGAIAAFIFGALFIGLIYKQIPLVGWKLLLIPLVIIVYSQLPDLDSHSSRIKKRFFQAIFWIMILSSILSVIISPYLMLALLGLTGVFGLYLYKIPHRGPLHSFWFIFLASFPLVFIHWFLAMLAFICASSHLLADKVVSRLKRKVKKMFGIRSTQEATVRL